MNTDMQIIKCVHCGTKNRVAPNKRQEKPICGKCKQPLPEIEIFDHPVTVTDQTFNADIVDHPGTVLLDCWAPWCGPCRMIAPILEELAKEYAGKLVIAKLNVDENPATASRFSIRSIPTMLLFKNGRLIDTLVGALPKSEIVRHLRDVV